MTDLTAHAGMDNTEARLIQHGSGKWGDPSVPKKGWWCTDIIDHQDQCKTCEMCESKLIRYEHVMVHDDYGDPLGCGCICAGNMELDIDAAVKRQRDAVNRSAKAKREADRAAERAARLQLEQAQHAEWQIAREQAANRFTPEWRQAASGNWWTKATHGWRITVYQDKYGKWRYMFCLGDNPPVWAKAKFADADSAKAAAEAQYRTIHTKEHS